VDTVTRRWRRVSRDHPCPLCGKPDNCSVSSDGDAVWCGRISDGAVRENLGGQFLHILNERTPRPQSTPPKKSLRPSRDFGPPARAFASGCEEPRAYLARELGVSDAALRALGVGWHRWEKVWTIPERDAAGRIIGLATRDPAGLKKRVHHSQAGLTYADDWNDGTGPILLVEGASDTAAALTMGVNAVGRPSNLGGVSLLLDLLVDLPTDRAIIVLGERDQKPDGRWPGRDGALRTAERLAEGLERPIAWSLPPDAAKDTRAWLNQMPRELPTDRLRALFLSGLDANVIAPPPVYDCPPPDGPAIELPVWRDQMLDTRIASLGRPGYYLDVSPTGSGKTYIDLETLAFARTQEAACKRS
jgi:hypothetical protein